MLEQYEHSQDFYRITVVADPEKTRVLIDTAVQSGVKQVFVVKGRGIMHKKKIGIISVSGISPSFDMLNVIVTKPHLESVMRALVQAGRLNLFGAGAIYAARIQDMWFHGTQPFTPTSTPTPPAAENGVELQRDLVAINCICQLGHAEDIARETMMAGSPSPVISFGYGHGIRDRLGFFLQLTINPKKEIINLVVGSAESERFFEEMVEAGHLDQPAQGFIYTSPVEVGLINTMSFHNTSLYPATMEQIIKAIDQIQGNTNWRHSGSVQHVTTKKRKMLHNLVSLNCIVPRGFGDITSMVAMEAGAGGTSTAYANAFPVLKGATHHLEGSDEREMIALTIGEGQVQPVVKAIASMTELAETPVLLFAYPAPQALTYLK